MSARRVFLAYDDITISVFDSQVLVPIRKLQARGLPHDFIGFHTVGASFERATRERIERLQKEIEGRAVVLTTLPWLGRFDTWYPTLRVKRALADLGIRHDEKVVVHARGHYAGAIALSLKRAYPNLGLIANLRGLAGAELRLYGMPNWPLYRLDWRIIGRTLLRRLDLWERELARSADVVVCVSNAFRSHLCERYGIPEERVEVVTTAVDAELFRFDPLARDRVRRSLGLESKLVFAFCGSSHKWELPGCALRLLRRLLTANADAHLLILTHGPARVEKELARAGVPLESVTIRSVPHRQVPGLLMAADVGLLIREDNVVNSVAAPTKFAEYLASGLPVLVSEGVGDTAEVVTRHAAGWLLNPSDRHADEVLQRIMDDRRGVVSPEFKRHCAQVGEKLYSWDAQIKPLLRAYERAERA